MLLFVFIVLGLSSFGQGSLVCDGGYSLPIDSTDFSNVQGVNFHYKIDSSLPNNLWQVGGVSKAGFPNNVYGISAMQTDTLNPYSPNNVSVFEVWTDTVVQGFNNDSLISMSFWHSYDIDSLGDSCVVQITLDSGVTWLHYSSAQVSGQIAYDYMAQVSDMPNNSGQFLWTGQSAGWQRVKICYNFFTVKPARSIPWPVGFRFLFISDSVQGNKPGWIIDKIALRTPNIISSVKDYSKRSLPIYPNPSRSGQFTIDFPSNYVTGKFKVYDYIGRNVKTVELKEQIDLSDLPNGIYNYQAVFEKTNQWFFGKIEIE